ncbi:MAG: hypothetical protein HYX66_04325 [Ignavibacteria bacterium]|nr:hypothetical protein [Ignavibacteria bacterium]
MKHIYFLPVVLLCVIGVAQAQVPQTMNYQAVIRNASNELVANQNVSVRISIVQGALSSVPVYTEVHQAQSNLNGLVTLEIGAGVPVYGTFSAINWANGPYYIRTETDVNGGDAYSISGSSPLLSVPFALRAETAENAISMDYNMLSNKPLNVSAFFNDVGYLTLKDFEQGKAGDVLLSGSNGVPANVWSLKGNSKTDPDKDAIGTTDDADLVFITNGEERFRITSDGNVSISNGLSVGDVVEVGTDLYVKKNVYLNTEEGATTNYGNFTVENMSSTYLTGTLVVDKAASLNSTLDVDGATTMNSTLDVDGATTLNNTLDVDGASQINNTLLVTSNQANHVVTIVNTNGDQGDGLLIRIGRTHGAWNGSAYLQIANPSTILAGSTLNTVKGWLNGASFSVKDLWTIFPGAAIAGALAQVTNTIIDEINDGLNLPYTLVPNVQVFPGFNLGLPDIPSIVVPEFCVSFGELGSFCRGPWTLFGGVTIPDISIPSYSIGPYTFPAIPNIPANGLPTIEIPNFQGSSVTNSLTRDNHYITFQDKDGRQTGAIKAESVSDWRDNTVLDDVYLTNLAASFIGIDLLGAAVTGFSEIINTIALYNTIGVAYESGNGDYAEWLERADHTEYISAGDVVGVHGGKISKNLDGAEQVMVVSHKPIVLGNMPEANQRPYGNDVAFMGQVPVKVMGRVSSGDYIVASGTVKGYGIAVSPSKIKTEEFTKVVGRSWENIPTDGPKMVNTVIGVHNGDWVKIVKKIEARQSETDRRLQRLELKLKQTLGLEVSAEPLKDTP